MMVKNIYKILLFRSDQSGVTRKKAIHQITTLSRDRYISNVSHYFMLLAFYCNILSQQVKWCCSSFWKLFRVPMCSRLIKINAYYHYWLRSCATFVVVIRWICHIHEGKTCLCDAIFSTQLASIILVQDFFQKTRKNQNWKHLIRRDPLCTFCQMV